MGQKFRYNYYLLSQLRLLLLRNGESTFRGGESETFQKWYFVKTFALLVPEIWQILVEGFCIMRESV